MNTESKEIVTIDGKSIQRLEYKDIPVVTTQMLSDLYGGDEKKILMNYYNNKKNYIEEKHYFKLVQDELKMFRSNTKNLGVAKNVNTLYLWTKKGAFLHAKSLNTKKAWEVYDSLIDNYFSNLDALNELNDKYNRLYIEHQNVLNQNQALLTEVSQLKERVYLIDNDTNSNLQMERNYKLRRKITKLFNNLLEYSKDHIAEVKYDTYGELGEQTGIDYNKEYYKNKFQSIIDSVEYHNHLELLVDLLNKKIDQAEKEKQEEIKKNAENYKIDINNPNLPWNI